MVMIQPGTTFRNEKTKEVITFVETAASSNGERAVFEYTIVNDGTNPVEHIHMNADEKFEVLSGTFSYSLDGKKGEVKAGESITLPKGIRHQHGNWHAEPARIRQTITPAHDFEDVVAKIFELTRDGKMPGGEPPFLQAMVWMKYCSGKTYLANIPVPVQKVLSAVLGPVGKLAGYRSHYI
jgi:quercetin dioxygenase-like cupin family protein